MPETLKTAILEDTPADAGKLSDCLSHLSIPTTCTLFENSESFLKEYRPGSYDLILADIFLGNDQPAGLETIRKIRSMGDNTPVAFTTTSLDFTLESYRLSALKYIEKPVQPAEVEDILNLALLKKKSLPSLSVYQNRKEERIPFSRILYLEQQKHILRIVLCGGDELTVYDKLTPMLPTLEQEHFFCPHKSFAVNLAFVRYIDSEIKCFVMQNGDNVPIRRQSLTEAKRALETYLFIKTRRLSGE